MTDDKTMPPGYYESLIRNNDRLTRKLSEEAADNTISVFEQQRIEKEFEEVTLPKIFKRYKDTGSLGMCTPAFIHDYLVKKSVIDLSDDERKVLYEEAKAGHKRQMVEINPKRDDGRFDSVKHAANRFLDGLEAANGGTIKVFYKRLCIMAYFDKIENFSFETTLAKVDENKNAK